MVVLGYENALPVTMDIMITTVKPLSAAPTHALIVGDMPS